MDQSMQDNTERPAKRPCLSYTPADEGEALPDFDLSAARAQNDSRLKSLFEGIFAKYSHDFTDVGDEIDLATGDIVVDNGHLLGLRAEDDNGKEPRSWLLPAGSDNSEDMDGPDGDDTKGEEFFSLPASPRDRSPAAFHESSPSIEQNTTADTSLDFVFTFKASGATGLSPTTKEGHISRPTNPIAVSKPQDPLWEVPDLPQSFSTPTAETRKTNVFLPSARSPSPPGSGSVWAVRQPGRPRTEAKPKATPSKRRLAAKRNYNSSPLTRDWSFAEIPDGNESDDPLQDCEPSLTPSKLRIIRGKHKVPTKDHDGPSTPHEQRLMKQPDLVVEEDHDDCEGGNATTNYQEYDASINEKDDTPEVNAPNDMPLGSMFQNNLTPKASIEAYSPQPSESTPSKKQLITPDEGKLIVCMMHKDGKKANDVLPMLPGRDYQGVWHWFYYHWTRRLANPPPLSAAWSEPELASLSRLSIQSGLTWAQIQHEFKGRTRHEVEFELLRAFVGEGFSSTTAVEIEEPMESKVHEEKEYEESSDDSIKEESESDTFEEVDEEENGTSSPKDTQEEHGIQEGNTRTDSKASNPNDFLGIFINSYK
ncbi:hypothetical protein N7457_006330 [Penicillium paradoxum]|uniref:uncharacterized protein n=1 Tax=Penicillium paradoxum TaxID=176176 RepID=UPI00254693C7|nr:uncharacterized protein N7457_006330 [Penicillium paradoxum]KAJ5781170.1 hypothetical protein N7457_006330 [Penicillium paradoxum]